MKYSTILALTACLALPGAGCLFGDGDDDSQQMMVDCDDETRADEYVAGLEKQGSQVLVSLVSEPAPPAKGDNVWTLTITDLQGAPIDGLSIDSDPFMPDHGHGTPLQENVSAGDEAGQYVLDPINLWMPGYWEVTIDISGDGVSDSVMFAPCIEG